VLELALVLDRFCHAVLTSIRIMGAGFVAVTCLSLAEAAKATALGVSWESEDAAKRWHALGDRWFCRTARTDDKIDRYPLSWSNTAVVRGAGRSGAPDQAASHAAHSAEVGKAEAHTPAAPAHPQAAAQPHPPPDVEDGSRKKKAKAAVATGATLGRNKAFGHLEKWSKAKEELELAPAMKR
jgi:hypothetical protein